MFKPQIASHWAEQEAETTYQCIVAEAAQMTEDEIVARCQECLAEADKWNSKMIHDPKLQDSRDRMYGRWVADLSEMATIWSMV